MFISISRVPISAFITGRIYHHQLMSDLWCEKKLPLVINLWVMIYWFVSDDLWLDEFSESLLDLMVFFSKLPLVKHSWTRLKLWIKAISITIKSHQAAWTRAGGLGATGRGAHEKWEFQRESHWEFGIMWVKQCHKPAMWLLYPIYDMSHWLVVTGTFFIFPYIGNVIIPIDFHIFQRGWSHQPEPRLSWKIHGLTMNKCCFFSGIWWDFSWQNMV